MKLCCCCFISPCPTFLWGCGQYDKHLRALARLLTEEGAAARYAGAAAVRAVLEADASTHWCLAEVCLMRLTVKAMQYVSKVLLLRLLA